MKNFILIFFVALSLYSCSDTTDINEQNCGTVTNVLYESFKYCGVLKEKPKQASFIIINSEEELQKQFNACDPFGPLPDFTQKRILGLLSGPKPSSGYSIKIQAVVENDCQILVDYSEREPSDNEIVLTTITYPADYIVLPKSDKPILFRKVKEIVEYEVIVRKKI